MPQDDLGVTPGELSQIFPKLRGYLIANFSHVMILLTTYKAFEVVQAFYCRDLTPREQLTLWWQTLIKSITYDLNELHIDLNELHIDLNNLSKKNYLIQHHENSHFSCCHQRVKERTKGTTAP